MRYFIITSSYPANKHDSRNTGVFIRNFAGGLQDCGHEVLVYTPDKKGQKETKPKVPVVFFKTLGDTTELVNLNPKNPWDALKLISVLVSGCLSLLLTIRKFRPQKILGCWILPSGIFVLFAYKIFGINYDIWALGSDIWKINRYPFGSYMVNKILANADRVFANSDTLIGHMKERTKKPIILLRTTRRLNFSAVAAKVKKEKINFLMIGRFHPDKGADILLEAFDSFRRENKNVFLYMFGGGPEKKRLHDQIMALNLSNDVHLGDYLDADEVAGYLKACDCLVIPSRRESMPVVFSEAVQFDRPVIVTDVGDMGLLCRKYNYGLVASPTSGSLKEKLTEFYKTPLQKKAPQELKDDFDINRIVEKFISISQNES